MKKIVLGLILILILSSSLSAAGRRILIDSVKIVSNSLVVDFRAEGIIDDKISEGLRKGRTSTLEYRVQLWGKKSGLLNQLIEEKFIRIKINYDFWENKYVIYTPEEKRMTRSIETVREKCTEFGNYVMASLGKLERDLSYSVSVEMILKPLSVENYQEIKNWLSGEVKDINLNKISDPEKQEKGFKNRILKMFMAITGFGERVLSNKTKYFKIENNQIIWR